MGKKVLYLDCGMGAAGDMLTAALLELLSDPEEGLRRLNALGIPQVHYAAEEAIRCGIGGTRVAVKIDGVEESDAEMHVHGHDAHTHDEHTHGADGHDAHTHDAHAQDTSHHVHRSLEEIKRMIASLAVSDQVKRDAEEVYTRIAEAESHVHRRPVSEVHFHEVGTMDAVADVAAVCALMEWLAPDAVVVSPVHVGSGQVRCAHGILPVPAPATAYLLRDVPIYGGEIRGELCTPTGAALLAHFADRFGTMPRMCVERIGYGMGKKEFERANCVRAFWGEEQAQKPEMSTEQEPRQARREDEIIELACNVDDMTAEEIGFAMEQCYAGGAKEVFTTAVGMKKNRPGTMITVLCDAENRDRQIELLMRHTTTLGIRETQHRRYVLARETVEEETVFGKVRKKKASGYGVHRSKYEYEDLAEIARRENVSLEEVRRRIQTNA